MSYFAGGVNTSISIYSAAAKAKFLVAKKGDGIVALGIPKQKSGGFPTTSVEIRPRLRLQARRLLIK
jgi:hypothetical protein